jgi:hypothetical protein
MKATALSIGDRFGRLAVIGEVPISDRRDLARWQCRCDCGQVVRATRSHLVSGGKSSCGCLRPGLSKRHSLTYSRWRSMLDRCHSARGDTATPYGQRGIQVCARWRGEFTAFLDDMGQCPSRHHTLDRIKNHVGYQPGNCRWATRAEQMRNRSNSAYLTFMGETLIVTDWAARFGLLKGTLRGRLAAGWSVEKALTTPVNTNKGHRRIHARSKA